MDKHNKISALFKGKGFYAVVAVVMVGAALASFLAINNMMHKLSTAPNSELEEKQWGLEDTEVNDNEANIPKPSDTSSQQQNAVPSPSAQLKPSTAQDASKVQPMQPIVSYVPPMSSQATVPFSGNELVYSETLSDWRTHNGQDYQGSAGDAVTAPMDAEVTRVYEDALWGHVVELKDAQITVRLMGLSAGTAIKAGDTVQQSAAIGTLGEVPAEAKDGAHLHVEVLKDDVLQNPADYF